MTWRIPGYEHIRELGEGATGIVILARHEQTGTSVAIKYLSDSLRADADGLARFRSEARLLSGLTSPYIAGLYEYVECDLGAGIVMELVNGPALRTMIGEQGPIEPEAALAVLKGSLLGLAAAHAVEVVHRDYKPENVLVDGAGNSKLVDFGIAVPSGAADTTVAGTASYLAPECWHDGPISPASDVYAATATFFECLTGRPPFVALDPAALRRQHANAPIPSDDVPEPLRKIVRRGLAKDPTRRPGDAAGFAGELDQIAVDSYGADWEEKGRRHLARRASLLLLFWPVGATVAGTALARTVLGLSARRWAVSGGIALAVVIIATTAAGVGTSRPGHAATGTGPLVSTTLTPSATSSSPSSSPRPSRSPSHRASRTRPAATVTASPSITPTVPPTVTPTLGPPPSSPVSHPPPPPPPVQVVKVTIDSFVEIAPQKSEAKVTVRTATTGPVTLHLTYYAKKIGFPSFGTSFATRDYPLSGATSYLIDDFVSPYSECGGWRVVATTTPAAANGTQTVDIVPPTPC